MSEERQSMDNIQWRTQTKRIKHSTRIGYSIGPSHMPLILHGIVAFILVVCGFFLGRHYYPPSKEIHRKSGLTVLEMKSEISLGKIRPPPEPLDPLEYWSIMGAIFFLVLLEGRVAGTCFVKMILSTT